MKREQSDLVFNSDIIHTFYSDYSYIYNDDLMYSIMTDKVYSLDAYSYLWIFREVYHKAVNAGLKNPSIDDTHLLVTMAINIYPDYKERSIELAHYFRDFLELDEPLLAQYAIQLLGDI